MIHHPHNTPHPLHASPRPIDTRDPRGTVRRMSFDWQPLDQAAQTLGVDSDTLRQWITDGRAPSRAGASGTEVLIEFPEDDDADDIIDVDASPPDAESPQALQLVPRHELQLAGAMAAAWQRMAEHSETELARTRRVGTVGYIALALLVIAAGIGLWYATAETTAARSEAASTAADLKQRIADLDIARKDKDELTAKVDQLQSDLTETKTQLATATERATQLTTAAEQTKQQHDKLVANLEAQLADLRKRIDQTHKDLAAARKQIESLDKSKTDLETRNEKLTNQIETLRKEIETLKSPPPAPASAPEDSTSGGENLFEGNPR